MKRRIIFFFALVLCFTNTCFSQTVLKAVVTSTENGAEFVTTDPHPEIPERVYARRIIGTVEGVPTEIYCIDRNRTITIPDSYHHLSYIYTFTDNIPVSGNYIDGSEQSDVNENFEYHNLNNETPAGAPSDFVLNQNYPNPFNPSTTINFKMPVEGFVSLKIFNSSGKEVATLLNEKRPQGYLSVNFDGSDLSSGVYYYKLETNNFSKVMKMALIK